MLVLLEWQRGRKSGENSFVLALQQGFVMTVKVLLQCGFAGLPHLFERCVVRKK